LTLNTRTTSVKKHSLVILVFAIIFASYLAVTNRIDGLREIPCHLGFGTLTLEIGSQKREYLYLEPITFSIVLTNKNMWPVPGHEALDFGYPFIRLFLISENGTRAEIQRLSEVSYYSVVETVIFRPGDRYGINELLYLDLSRNFAPGRYVIEAELQDTRLHCVIRSNGIWIQVKMPTDAINLAAIAYILKTPDPDNFFSALRTDVTLLQEFLAQHGGSVYAVYVESILDAKYNYRVNK